jgi:hypothetical protein
MKKLLLIALSVCGIYAAKAQVTVQTVQDSISSNTTWTNNKQYLLKGFVYVTSGTTLTIDSGVIIKGDKNTKGTLIIERGAKLIAKGTPTAPIVFTSNQPAGARSYGDWGGVILCGYAPTNWTAGQAQVEGGPRSFYGGTNPADNSGTLQYVRIEFPGVAFSPGNEVNGLTLCAVGTGTQIDHIQVSYSGDDSYEWFGGTANAKYLVSYRGWDDDFDTDCGYAGKNQFVFGIRDPYAADQSGSKAFENDSYLSGTISGLVNDSNATKAIWSNVTVVGPLVSPTSTAWDPQFVAAVHARRGSSQSILNSVLIGWPVGMLLDESSSSYGSTINNLTSNQLQFKNNIVAGNQNATDVFYVKDGARSLTPTTTWGDTTIAPWSTSGLVGPKSWLTSSANKNKLYPTAQTGVKLQSPFNLVNPNPVPTSQSPICYATATFGGITRTFDPTKPVNTDTTGLGINWNVPGLAPDFTTSKASDAFFTKVNYVGAFAGTQTTSDNWMAKWTNFDPVNTDYSMTNTTEFPTSVANLNNNINAIAVYPNPAIENATINFTMIEASNATVSLIDMTGKTVAAIFNGNLTAGNHQFEINVANLAMGCYFVQVQTSAGSKTIKLSVTK